MIGELLPDQPDYKNPGVIQAKNLIPYAQAYRPAREPSVRTQALDARCRGARILMGEDGTTYDYAATGTIIYERNGTGWDTLQAGYGTGPLDFWEFDTWYGKALATNNSSPVQYGDLGGPMADADTEAPIGKHLAVARNYVMVGNLKDNGATPAVEDAAGVSWCAVGDPTNWQSGDAGYQHLDGAGAVTKVLGGEYFTICMQNGIYRATAIGPPATFQFDLAVPNRPVPFSGAVVQVGFHVYFLSHDGFYEYDGSNVRAISSGKLSRTFLDEFDRDRAYLMSTIADVINNVIYFAYPVIGGDPAGTNKIMAYNYQTGLWGGPIEEFTEQLTVMDFSGDATAPEVGGFGATHTLQTYVGGTPKAGTIETGEYAHNEGGYTLVQGFRPFVDGTAPDVKAQIGYRDSTAGTVTYTTLSPINTRTGSLDERVNARYHRYLYEVAGDYESVQGGQPDIADGGRQ